MYEEKFKKMEKARSNEMEMAEKNYEKKKKKIKKLI